VRIVPATRFRQGLRLAESAAGLPGLRFISDQVLTGRLRSSGGGVLYEMSEPFLNDRPVESVAPG
jgi:hypothetical protein